MNSQTPSPSPAPLSRFMDRRGFLRTSALTSSGVYLATSKGAIAQQTAPGRTIKCALVGCGSQGNKALRVASKDVPGIQWVAMCDIWKYSLDQARGGFRSENKHQVEGEIKVYQDINEMLDKEPSIEAVFIATPDFLHAPYSRLCLEKGKSVYCEKMMSNTLEGARDMVRAGKANNGIFQIGHQRHSNPRYINLRENIIKPGKMMGRITHAYAQWNRGVSGSAPQGMVKGYDIPSDVLAKNGYGSIEEFRNWRFFAKYGGGPLSDLGAHQIDMFNWMYEATPVSVIASGGVDYFDGTEGRPKFELPDNMMCIYEFKTPQGALRAYYQVLTTTGSQGAYEKHMGIGGTAIISELDANGNQLYAEPGQDWEPYALGDNPPIMKAADKAKNKFWEHPRDWEKPKPPSYGAVSVADVRESKALAQWELAVKLQRKPHSPHVQNFIEAVQTKNPAHLTCPVEMAYKSCVTVLKAYESVKTGSKYIFTPEDFQA